jgi:phosphoribosylglycinamide formyltransferase 1
LCGGAAFARRRGIHVAELPQKAFASAEQRDVAMRDFFKSHGVELVVDAGYDRIQTAALLDAFEDRVINLHPSLLPDFGGGMDAIERAIASGAKMTGATVHLVTEALDAGPILIQEAVPILEGDTVETLRQRVNEAEHRILPHAIRLMEARMAPRARRAP